LLPINEYKANVSLNIVLLLTIAFNKNDNEEKESIFPRSR